MPGSSAKAVVYGTQVLDRRTDREAPFACPRCRSTTEQAVLCCEQAGDLVDPYTLNCGACGLSYDVDVYNHACLREPPSGPAVESCTLCDEQVPLLPEHQEAFDLQPGEDPPCPWCGGTRRVWAQDLDGYADTRGQPLLLTEGAADA